MADGSDQLSAIATYFNAWILHTEVFKTEFSRGKYHYKIERTEIFKEV